MANETTEKKERFTISVLEHEEFPKAYEGYFVKSTNFCKMVSAFFRTVYSDFEGCTLEFTERNRPYLALYFNQREEAPTNGTVAATCRFSPESNTGNGVLDRRRQMDGWMKYGDRYYLTEEGKEGLEDLLLPEAFDQKRRVNWGKIVAPVSYTNNQPYAPKTPQYTKVNFISMDAICDMIYGVQSEDGKHVHSVSVLYSLNPTAPGIAVSRCFMLRVDRMNDTELREIAQNDLGFMIGGNDINIVR